MKKIALVFRDKDKKFQTSVLNRLKKRFKNIQIKTFWKNKLSENSLDKFNLIISIGGDGTFLSATHLIDKQLILGVNHDENKSEGALTTITLKNLEKKVLSFLEGNFKIKEYARANAKIIQKNKCILTKDALNEIYIGNKNPYHTSKYKLTYKKKEENQVSSGILISTGAGSSAWYKTMGGHPFLKTKRELRFIIREPYSRKIHKVKIKKGKIKNKKFLKIKSLISHKILSIDSIRSYSLKKGNQIIISLGKPLRVIQ